MSRKRSTFPTLTVTILVLLVLGLLLFVAVRLITTDEIRSWFGAEKDESSSQNALPAGTVAVPICPRDIPAYTKILRDHLWSPEKQIFAYIAIPEDQVPEGAFRTINDIRGRVTRRVKKRGFVFTEDDFYPAGTREGLVAAIPPGMRSMRVATSQIQGLHFLKPGDRFDVVGARTIEPTKKGVGSLVVDANVSSMLDASTRRGKRADVSVLVRNGIVIEPVKIRAEPKVGASLTRGTFAQALPVQEVVIAVRPDEVTHLAQAFATDVSVWCTARSGRPDGEDTEMTELVSESPLQQLLGAERSGVGDALVERISGIERTHRLVIPLVNGSKRIENGAPFDRGESPASVAEKK